MSSSIDADLQLAGLLQNAGRRLESSERLRQQARILEAAAELDEAHSTLAEISQLCQLVDDTASRLREQQAENRQSLQGLKMRCAQLASEVDEQRTMERTLVAYRSCLAAYEDAERLVFVGDGAADPAQAAVAIDNVARQLEEVQQSLTADRDLYAEAARSCEAARSQMQTATSLSEQASSDRLPDSDVTQRALAEIRAIGDQVNQLRLRLTVAHEDWQALDQQADQLTLQAGQAASTLRGDLQRGQRCAETLRQASEQVRRAAGWTGAFGINILGTPGGDDLEMARRAFARGDYDGAMRFAANAIALAKRSIQEAEMRVRERRRAEQRRRAYEAADGRRF